MGGSNGSRGWAPRSPLTLTTVVNLEPWVFADTWQLREIDTLLCHTLGFCNIAWLHTHNVVYLHHKMKQISYKSRYFFVAKAVYEIWWKLIVNF